VHQIQMEKPQVERPGAFLWATDSTFGHAPGLVRL
jgi:hypothetical protein